MSYALYFTSLIKRLVALLGLLSLGVSAVFAEQLDQRAVAEFIAEMAREHDFDKRELTETLQQAKRSSRILNAMSRPAEKAKPWYEYRKFFLTEQRIAGGTAFWDRNADTLGEASRIYGVPEEIIVAIIGVETSYGRITGSDRVIDALSTLAFHYPKNNVKRMKYFRAQLTHLFLMSREQNLDPLSLSGSYAGAMGIPQFMPESYRKFAVDFDKDGRRNIWDGRKDAIGSVANYLKSHGWSRGKPIVLAASTPTENATDLLSDNVKPNRLISEFSKLGVAPRSPSSDELAALFTLEGDGDLEYWLALNNFYVIMRYNPRTKYAMAVVQLAEAIRDARTHSASS